MAKNPPLRARFFVAPDGTVTERAKHPNKSHKLKVFQRDNWCCTYCGRPVTLDYIPREKRVAIGCAQVDHLLPISRGGQNDMANLATACLQCNASRGATNSAPLMSPAERIELQSQDWLGYLNLWRKRRAAATPARTP